MPPMISISLKPGELVLKGENQSKVPVLNTVKSFEREIPGNFQAGWYREFIQARPFRDEPVFYKEMRLL